MQEKEKICLHCREAFIPKRSDAQYCSPSCKQLAYLTRKNEEGSIRQELIEPQEEELPVKTLVKTSVNTSVKSASIADNKPAVNEQTEPIPSLTNRQQKKQVIQQNAEADEDENEGPKSDEDYMEWKQLEWDVKKAMGEDMSSRMKKWGYAYTDHVAKTNIQFRQWINTVIGFSKREISAKEVRELIGLIRKYQEGYDYKYLPSDYPYKEYIEDLKDKLKLVAVTLEMDEEDTAPMTISEKRKTDFTYILMDIDE